MYCAGSDFAVPARNDRAARSVAAAILSSDIRYDGYRSHGGDRDRRFRPRTRAELRGRRFYAARHALPLAGALARRDPWRPSPGRHRPQIPVLARRGG
ncbi:hypothetical protein ABZV91_23425, partial [Nocardia sp. NPDC004568]|uniref:hypothetical protein n=1 Tax=Nocardia sp. NPDC004568 TaxID=3154551 RepID=UPI0033A92682